LLTACGSRPGIVVGSKNFTEQVILGELLAQQVERRLNIAVTRKLNLGGTLLAHEALRTGAIDLYPEYTGTALTAILKQPAAKDSAGVLAGVRAGYRQWRLEWLDPLGFNNTFAMVVLTRAAHAGGISTLSAAAQRDAPWRLGVGYEFVQRPDGLAGMLRAYNLRLNGAPVTMDLGLLYPALETGKIEMAAASATDGLLARPEFTVLTDDRRYFPPYDCAVVARADSLARHSGLADALNELSGRISEDAMRRMNAAVDREHRNVAEVAKQFLTSFTSGGAAGTGRP
jgi:glycine betaine/choline ABC-type transport system substrate-binding protein